MADQIDALATKLNHAVWYAYQITVGGSVVGSLQNFSATQTQETDRVREIDFTTGTKVLEILAGGTDIRLRAERIQIFKKPLFAALGLWGDSPSGSEALEDFKGPFDIVETEKRPDGTKRVRTYYGCVIASQERTITIGTIYIAERCDIECAYMKASDGVAS
jgi:hypothetical protein